MRKKVISLVILFASMVFFTNCSSLMPSKEEVFFNSPLLNEFGEEIATNSYKPKSTEDFSITFCGIGIKPNSIDFEFMFAIKNPNIKIEYVKIQSVIPNDVLTFIDETQKNGNSNPSVKVSTKITKKENNYIWSGVASNIPNIIFTPDLVHRYLFKFIIKSVGRTEVVIYQPCILQVAIFNEKN